jgi:hypothetical protein
VSQEKVLAAEVAALGSALQTAEAGARQACEPVELLEAQSNFLTAQARALEFERDIAVGELNLLHLIVSNVAAAAPGGGASTATPETAPAVGLRAQP